MRIFPHLRLAALALLATFPAGCATTMAIIGPHNVMTSDRDSDATDGEREERMRGARYSTAERAVICEAEWRYPRETTRHLHYGYDTGGRLALGFIGFGEMLIGGVALAASVGAAERGAAEWTIATVGGLIALDGIVTLLLGILLDDFAEGTVTEREGRWSALDSCPGGAELWLGSLRITPDEAGQLPLPKTAEAWSGSFDLVLRHGTEELVLPMGDEGRCTLAGSLGLTLPLCEVPTPSLAEPQVVPPAPGRLELRFELRIGESPAPAPP